MANSEWAYAGVHLSIDNYVIPQEKLFPTPSNLDGLDAETEFDLRYVGCELIQDAGTLLRLPQVAMATAQVLYQRYFYSKSFVRYVYEVMLRLYITVPALRNGLHISSRKDRRVSQTDP